MSSIVNMLYSIEDDGLNLVIMVSLFAVVVAAVTLILKVSLHMKDATKKTKSISKQQKLHTVNYNKTIEEKLNSEKKEKRFKENRSSSSPKKSLDKQSVNDTVKSNKKQHSAVGDKESKKHYVQAKKLPVNNVTIKHNSSSNKNGQISHKKQKMDIIINKEEGEWQMVTTKKQKQTKQEDKVEIVKTTKSASKKSQSFVENVYKQSDNKTNKDKEVTEKNDLTNIANFEGLKPELIQTLNHYSKESVKSTANLVPAAPESSKTDTGLNNTEDGSVNNNKIKTLPAQEATFTANVVFDELGDDVWMDTKPQKKNKRRALRE